MSKQLTLERIDKLIELKNPDEAWDFFELDFSSFSESEIIELEMKLFELEWHNLHEEIARSFQLKKDPKPIELLYSQALNEAIDIFEYKPLARKCTWALADIGTEKANAHV